MSEPLFRFGVVADTQYCDRDRGQNFSGSVKRWYRPSLEALKTIIARWKHSCSEGKGPKFILQLADLIDGYSFEDGHREKNLTAALDAFDELPGVEKHHMVGNHEMACFRPDELLEHGFGLDGKLYYSFQPHKGWRIVVLDSMGVSTVRPGCNKFTAPPEGDVGYAEARKMLMENNENLKGGEATWYSGINWQKGLKPGTEHYMPYNGALGQTQREWLQRELEEAKKEGEKVIIATHVPILPDFISDAMLDKDVTLAMLKEAGNVVAFFAGHSHRGGYAEEAGTAHVTFMSSLEIDPEVAKECGATISVYPDRIEVEGHGAQTSHTIRLT